VDIALYSKVIWRFRLLFAVGLIFAAFLSVFSVASIGRHGVHYRKPLVWQSTTTLLLTQNKGFPEGRAILPPASAQQTYPYADTGRLAFLAELYTKFATSDAVRALLKRSDAAKASISAATVQGSSQNILLPLIAISGDGSSAKQAEKYATLGARAFATYMTENQAKAGIPLDQRVDIRVLQAAAPATVLQPRKKTLPIVAFIAVLAATFALAFILENLRPRVRVLPQTTAGRQETEVRRTA